MTMDVSYIARSLTLSEAFREHVVERAERLATLAEPQDALEVKVSTATHHRHAEEAIRVELTVRGPREVVRAEAYADDKTAAFDAAAARLAERLRRLRDRRKDRRHGTSRSRGAGEVPFVAPLPPVPLPEPPAGEGGPGPAPESGTPVTIREKAFPATPMRVEEAVDAMELVGHDFFLFQNAATGVPSVVYRRRGWSYGVLRLDEALPADHLAGEPGPEREYRPDAGAADTGSGDAAASDAGGTRLDDAVAG